MPESRGEKKGTFVVEVEYCRNATWQGTIRWINGEKTQHFRSELELITLMSEVLRQSGDSSPILPSEHTGPDTKPAEKKAD